jgi:hypothetical protein|tara:strand:- start:392 stop:709 length:318 start_codon:yes stop_codon:yes gene_type:complete
MTNREFVQNEEYKGKLVESSVAAILNVFDENNFPYYIKKNHLLDILFITRIVHALIDNHFQQPNTIRPMLDQLYQTMVLKLEEDKTFNNLWKKINEDNKENTHQK